MPIVQTDDIRGLVTDAVKKFEREKNTSISSNYQKNFGIIAESIKNKYGIDLKGETLYKNVYLKSKRHSSPTIRYHKRYLNGLSRYVAEKDYEHFYPIIPQSSSQKVLTPPKVYVCLNIQKPDRKFFTSIDKNLSGLFTVVPVYRDTLGEEGFKNLYASLEEKDWVISLVNRTFLQSEMYLRQLIPFLSSPSKRSLYLKKTLHLILNDTPLDRPASSNCHPDLNIFYTSIRTDWVTYWHTYEKEVKSKFSAIQANLSEDGIKAIEEDLQVIERIKQEIYLLLERISKDTGTILVTEEGDLRELKLLIQAKSDKTTASKEDKKELTNVPSESLVSSLKQDSIKKSNPKIEDKHPSPTDEIEMSKLKGYFDAYYFDEEAKQFYELPSSFQGVGDFRLKGKSNTFYSGKTTCISPGKFELEFTAEAPPCHAYRTIFCSRLSDECEMEIFELAGKFNAIPEEVDSKEGRLYLIRRSYSCFESKKPRVINPFNHFELRQNEFFKNHFEKELASCREGHSSEENLIPVLG